MPADMPTSPVSTDRPRALTPAAKSGAKRAGARPSRLAKRQPEADLTVQIACRREGIPHRRSILRWVNAALGGPAFVTIRFAARPEARRLNKAYRGRDYATNVLTFTYPSPPGLSDHDTRRSHAVPAVHGDIVICPDVVAREAREQGKPLRAHHAHLVVHGVLHLQGLDHETDAEAGIMERREQEILGALGYPDPYADSGATVTSPTPRKAARRSRKARLKSQAC